MSQQFDNQQLEVVIVGAGLGGLGAAISIALAGHRVRVVEQAPELHEIGAGLQITPNGSRLLQQWKLPPSFWKSVARPTALTVHRYSGEALHHEANFDAKINGKYSAPFVDVHRADLQKALYDRAIELGVEVFFGERLVVMDLARSDPCIKTASNKFFKGDLVVAADGLWSKCREIFLGAATPPIPTGDLAYRIVLTLDQIPDQDLKEWVMNPTVHFWIGPGAHVVGYSVRGGEMYNMVLLVPDNLPPGVLKQEGSSEEMRALFDGWDPILSRFLRCAPKVDKWKLQYREEMDTWVNEWNNLVFLGDACHPMLPYLAQGANSSLEDGAVLGGVLRGVSTESQLADALATFQKLRKSRGEAIVQETFKQRHDFHLPDGQEQEDRDAVLRLGPGGSPETPHFPSRWTCPQVQPWLYGYDATMDAEKHAVAGKQIHG